MSIALQLSRARKAFDVLSSLVYSGIVARSILPVSLLEVGARGGLQSRWKLLYALGGLQPVFVEADPTEADELERRYGKGSVLPVAAGDCARAATLFITRSPGRTSVLRPDRNAIEKYRSWNLPLDMASYDVLREQPIDLVPLDSVLVDLPTRFDFVKTDVQGFDLNVLQGLEKRLAFAANVMCEVNLIPIYEGQATFEVLLEWMLSRGFKLISFRPFGDNVIEGNAHFENTRLDDNRSKRLNTLWRKLFGISTAEVNHALSH